MEDYETSERSCIKESHVIEITQSALKITGKRQPNDLGDMMMF